MKFFTKLKYAWPLIILALADVAVMAIPFYMENFIPMLYKNFRLNATDYSQAGAIYGFCALPLYLFGGYIADKFKSKHLIIISLIIMGSLGLWYLSLPFLSSHVSYDATKLQLYFIFAGFAVATAGLFWAPLWKLVKNHGTEQLKGELKEKQVGKNNGIQGSVNGLIGLTIALFGTLLLSLVSKNLLPQIAGVNLGFLILISIYVFFIILSIILVIFYIHEPKIKEVSFSLKSLWSVIKQWKIWLLGILVLGVYMMQMGLSSYINYLENVFLISTVAVMVLGIFRTYIMRFLISPYVGRKADKSHSYIFWMCIGLIIGITITIVSILLPGFNNDFPHEWSNASKILVQIVAGLNLVLLGAVAWAIVTIRWSPLGTELKLPNNQYGAGVNVISFIAFTPDAFFKQIKSAIEREHYFIKDGVQNADQLGNQLILATVVGFALIGLIAGIVLYFVLHREYIKNKFTKKSVISSTETI